MDPLIGLFYLTLNIYHEARSEDQVSQIAVAHVTLNRARDKHKSIKDIVLEPNQFSWTKTEKSYTPDDFKVFLKCLESAIIAIDGHDFTHGSTFYHNKSVKPYWTTSYQYIATFGSHKFYAKE